MSLFRGTVLFAPGTLRRIVREVANHAGLNTEQELTTQLAGRHR